MERIRDSIPGRMYGATKKTSADLLAAIAAVGGGLVGGMYSLYSKGLGFYDSVTEAVKAVPLIETFGYGTAAWMGAKAKNFLDLIVPLAIVQGDNLVKKVTEGSVYSWAQFLEDAKFETVGVAALYGGFLGLRALRGKRPETQPEEETRRIPPA